jgi:hypothetical protein
MNKEKKCLGSGHELKQLIGDRNSQEGRNQDVVVVEPCLVAAVMRRVHVSGSLALRGGTARRLCVHASACRELASRELASREVCGVAPRLLSAWERN